MLGFNNLDSIFAKPKANNQVRIKKGLNALQQTNDASIEGKDYVREQGFSTIIDKSTHELAVRPEIIIDNLVEDVNSIDVDQDQDKFIYVVLMPFNTHLTVNRNTGNIETDIFNIPKKFRNILQFDINSIYSEKKIFKLYELSYWIVFQSKTFYITDGKFSLLKI
jgi:hypothetical protein